MTIMPPFLFEGIMWVLNPASAGERIEVVIRIPEQVANNLAGSGRPPAVTVCEVYQRVMNIALQTADPAGHDRYVDRYPVPTGNSRLGRLLMRRNSPIL